MHGLTQNRCQKLGDFINHNTIHASLHQTEEMMIKALHLNCLVDQEKFGIDYSGINYVSAC